jgi:serine/threonine protein kinase
MWSLGVVIFGMITGTLPWLDRNLNVVRSKIIENNYSLPNGISEACANIISRLLVLNPDNRLSADECLLLPWFDTQFIGGEPIDFQFVSGGRT